MTRYPQRSGLYSYIEGVQGLGLFNDDNFIQQGCDPFLDRFRDSTEASGSVARLTSRCFEDYSNQFDWEGMGTRLC